MTALVVGTAGHVDHGKTALVRALTGIDCDRLPEEKRRGITLDLGFAHLVRDGVEIGFVDVPGHERLLHNALAGLGGVRLLLLVVAADQGARAQTREHLEVARLLGVPELVVALTRVDLASAEQAELAELELAELLESTPWAGAPILRVSATTGEGVARLADELVTHGRAAVRPGRADDPVRLPVDRAFVLHGQGVVVTGTLARGELRAGDRLRHEPAGREVRVRGLEVHGRARVEAGAGRRVAVRLAGVEAHEIARGDELVGPAGPRPTRRLLARFELLADAPDAIERSTEVRLFLGATETPARLRPLEPARLEPGGVARVEIRPRRPVVAARGDRLIVRRLSPEATWGGGEVLDPRWHRPRGVELAPRLAELDADEPSALRAWLAGAEEAGATAVEIAERLGASAEHAEVALRALGARGLAVAGGGRWFAPAPLAELERRAERLLREQAAREPLADGLPSAELAQRLLRRRARPLAEFHLGWLARRGVLVLEGDRARRPGRRAEPPAAERGLAASLVEAYERDGLTPASPGEMARRLSAQAETVEGLVHHLVGRGRLIRLSGGLVMSVAAFDRLRAELEATGWERFGVGAFKDRFGLSRKWAIPLLERLDDLGVTRRQGDERVLARGGVGPAESKVLEKDPGA